MTRITLFAITIAAAILLAPIPDDDPAQPTTPYQVPTPSGPVLPGNQQLPPICLHAMQSCGFSLDPGTMTWQPRGGR